ncbi:MAG TPA: hypothetical protein VLP43_06355, partial [Solirubrobacteraceae bacterium]|nr:hypothetical protein [Solirubrobacteraceae bacterium]
DRVCVFGVLECAVAVEGVDRAEPGVAGAHAVAAVVFEVGKERADQRRVEIVEVELEWLSVHTATLPQQHRLPVRLTGGQRWRRRPDPEAVRDCGVGSLDRVREGEVDGGVEPFQLVLEGGLTA